MPQTIQVLDPNTSKGLGTGTGDINAAGQTAQITAWSDKAGLRANQAYSLKAGGKLYTATCSQVGLPAQFVNVQ